MVQTCPSDNTQATDQSSFWDGNNVNWDDHRIGWVIAGSFTVVTFMISIVSVSLHAANYTNRREQRQILRILYMPPVFGLVSFLSYRFFRAYDYYELGEVIYEAFCLSAFLFLIMEYVAPGARSGKERDLALQELFEEMDEKWLPLPLCCIRYHPEKVTFVPAIKWTVLQYAIFRPLISIAAIICQSQNVLCESEGIFHPEYAYMYLSIFDFISISVALYGLIIFYAAIKNSEHMEGKRPLAKFLCIKLIVMFTFYQSLLFDFLEGRVIHATEYWTETNIADGLDALCTCVEMSIFAALMLWAYPSTPYKQLRIAQNGEKQRSFGGALLESINLWDFLKEFGRSTKVIGKSAVGRGKGKGKGKRGKGSVESTERSDSVRGTESSFEERRGHGGGGNSSMADESSSYKRSESERTSTLDGSISASARSSEPHSSDMATQSEDLTPSTDESSSYSNKTRRR